MAVSGSRRPFFLWPLAGFLAGLIPAVVFATGYFGDFGFSRSRSKTEVAVSGAGESGRPENDAPVGLAAESENAPPKISPRTNRSDPMATSGKISETPVVAEAEIAAANRNRDVADELNRLETEVAQLRKRHDRNEALFDELARLVEIGRRLSETDVTDPTLVQRRQESLRDLNDLDRFLRIRRNLFAQLDAYAAICGSPEEAMEFLRKTATKFPGTEYAADFEALAGWPDLVGPINSWNRLMTPLGTRLERLAVSAEDSMVAVNFYADASAASARPDFLPEWATFQKRVREFAVSARAIPFREKIKAILANRTTPYWLYSPEPGAVYYLTSPPETGENAYRANLFGEKKMVALTERQVAAVRPSPLPMLAAELLEAAENIPDSLRLTDVADWYRRWGAVLNRIRESEIDPLEKFFLLADVGTILSSGDYHFEDRLALWRPVLGTDRVPATTDPFDAENPNVRQIRVLVQSLLLFLPGDILNVDQTSDALDAEMEKIAFRYRVVGWLDLDLVGTPFFRPKPEESFAEDSQGELVLFRYLGESIDGKSPKFEMISGGRIIDGHPEFNLIASGLLRGTPIWLRSRISR